MHADAGPVAILEAWVNAHPRYSYTVQAKERNAAGVEITSAAHQTIMTLTDARGIACGPEYADGTITVDRITLDATDGHPVKRERLQGLSVVERWLISDLHVPA
jgi:hypothetical protein